MLLVGIVDALHFIVQQRTVRSLVHHLPAISIYKDQLLVALVLRGVQ